MENGRQDDHIEVPAYLLEPPPNFQGLLTSSPPASPRTKARQEELRKLALAFGGVDPRERDISCAHDYFGEFPRIVSKGSSSEMGLLTIRRMG